MTDKILNNQTVSCNYKKIGTGECQTCRDSCLEGILENLHSDLGLATYGSNQYEFARDTILVMYKQLDEVVK